MVPDTDFLGTPAYTHNLVSHALLLPQKQQTRAGALLRKTPFEGPAGFVFNMPFPDEESRYVGAASLLAAAGPPVRVLDNPETLEVRLWWEISPLSVSLPSYGCFFLGRGHAEKVLWWSLQPNQYRIRNSSVRLHTDR